MCTNHIYNIHTVVADKKGSHRDWAASKMSATYLKTDLNAYCYTICL